MSNLSSKAIILNKVALGRVFKSYFNAPNVTGPPPGFDCVVGEPGPVLNFDEVVVYDECAVIPAYLIIYGC